MQVKKYPKIISKAHGDKKKQAIKKDLNKKNLMVSSNKKNKTLKVKKSPIQEIVKEKKVKKEIPLRAKNDPRQSN